MISFRHKGDFSITTKFLERIKKDVVSIDLDKYGRAGVEALAAATPIDSGKTASSWEYEIIKNKKSIVIRYYNTNVQNEVPIAVILQYGHATKNGGWVEGIDYINPAIQPIFDSIVKEAWGEVTKS